MLFCMALVVLLRHMFGNSAEHWSAKQMAPKADSISHHLGKVSVVLQSSTHLPTRRCGVCDLQGGAVPTCCSLLAACIVHQHYAVQAKHVALAMIHNIQTDDCTIISNTSTIGYG